MTDSDCHTLYTIMRGQAMNLVWYHLDTGLVVAIYHAEKTPSSIE